MRPLRLQIEGFTCFKERQELDLSRLQLFAIVGPNGAGKSSLLDAMMLCLYGEVPRVGDRYTELISHGRERMALVLDFRVGPRVFRVTRTRRRKGAAQAQLEELTGGSERPLADGVREVDRQIEALLGLPYEAFTQAVVLPQGEFWKFLKSQPRERREILRELLRHQVYERMRQLAADQAGTLGQTVSTLQQRLDEDYAGATPDALADLRGRAERLTVEVSASKVELDRRRQVLQDVQTRHAKTRELDGCRQQLRTFEARGPEVQKMERCLDAARRVAPVIAIVRGAEELERAAEDQIQQAEYSETDRKRAHETHAAKRRHLDAAEVAAKELPALRDRIRQLDEVKGLVEARERVRTRIKRTEEERRGFMVELGKAERAEKQARVSAERIEQAVQDAVRSVRKVRYDADLDAGLEAVRDLAATLGTFRQSTVTLQANAKRAAGRAATEEAAAEKRQADVESAKKLLDHAMRAREESDRVVRDAEQKSAAALLRQDLKAGQPCPVCGQAVTAPPRSVKLPQLEALRSRRQRASEDERKARQAANEAAAAAAAALATAKETRAAAEGASQEAEIAIREMARQEAELEVKIGAAIASEPGATIEVRVQAAVQRVVGLRQRHKQELDTLQKAEKRRDVARVEVERAVQFEQALRHRLEQITNQTQETEAEMSRHNVEIGKVTQAPDPLAEREELAARQERLAQELEAARRAHQTAEAELAGAKARAEAEKKAAGEATRRARQSRHQATQAVREAGFEDELAAKAAALPDAEIARLATEVDRYGRDLHATTQRVANLLDELAGGEITDEDLSTAATASTEQERLVGETQRELARLEVEVHNLAKRVDRAAELSRELGEHQRDHGVYRGLADDLRSERFQAFVLDESFRELAKGGSARLMNLSGRYTFEYREDSFYVVDHDNAGEQRSADTLSGGETFLASLALALELSEQVQGAAGAVPLDSLFIDEGFGTLDPETLETVAGAIEALPLGGRMVGIITHVAELAERLPARVVVEKRNEGSRVGVEVG